MDELRKAKNQRECGQCRGKRRNASRLECRDNRIADVLVDKVERVGQRTQPHQHRRVEEEGAPGDQKGVAGRKKAPAGETGASVKKTFS